MSYQNSNQIDKGWFTDGLEPTEVLFSKNAALELERHAPWAKKMLQEDKIQRALTVQPDRCRSYSSLNEIKSALFEIRIAYLIHQAGLTAEYESPSGLGKSTFDFKLSSTPEWFIELTSLRESSATKEHTKQIGNTASYVSYIPGDCNSAEVRDIIKVQSVLCGKVSSEAGKPIKFPPVHPNIYHMIIIDARSFSIGNSDCSDYYIIVNGSESLQDIEKGIYYKDWKDSKGNSQPIRGLFDERHPDPRSRYVRERIHAVGFVCEKEYTDRGVIKNIKYFRNPHLLKSEEELHAVLPFKNVKT